MSAGDCGASAPDNWHWCVRPSGHRGNHLTLLRPRAWYDGHGFLRRQLDDHPLMVFADDSRPEWEGWEFKAVNP